MRKHLFSILAFLFSYILMTQPVYAQVQNWGSCVVNGVPTLKCAEVVFGNLLFLSSSFAMLVLFCMFMLGGWYYLSSFGAPEKVKKAQGTFRWAVIGFVAYLSLFIILRIIDFLFLGGEGKLFKFEIPGP